MKRLKALLELESPTEESRSFLARYNLPHTRTVVKNLKSVSKRLFPGEDPAPFLLTLLDQIRDSAYPEQALNQAERFFCRVKDRRQILQTLLHVRHALRILCAIFGASPYLSGIVVQEPDLFLWLVQNRTWNAPLDRESLLREILTASEGITDLQEAYHVLRRLKQREMLRIGARDLTGFADFSETTEALSGLAEAALEGAYRIADRFLRKSYGAPLFKEENGTLRECGFTILGMGKLGGGELNFSSDIDLLYLYESDAGETVGVPGPGGGMQGKLGNHLYFVRLSETITDMLQANTEDGFVFRVDLRLRPEGSQGPVASSLRSYELYYESFGQTWERAALLKCRPVAGDFSLGKKFEKMLRPFIYRKYLDYSAIDEIREMKRRILQGLTAKAARGVNIKLDRGGIREIEFFIQALQLIYGGRISWIREKNSLRTLQRLCDKKLVTYEDFSILSKAYLFLRDVEHKLQIENQLQIQTLPTAPSKLEHLARRCGSADGKALLTALEEHRTQVQRLFENLFYEKEETGIPEDPTVHQILGEEADRQEIGARLSALGFRDPRSAHKNIRLLRDGAPYAHPSSRSRALFLRIAPALLDALAASPDPDMALNNLERFVSGYGARETFYGLLEQDPVALQTIVTVFGISNYLSGLLIRHSDSMEVLFHEGISSPAPSGREILSRLMAGLRETPAGAPSLVYLRRFKHVEEIRIGLTDILTDPGVLKTSVSLSRLADACLNAAYTLALGELTGTYGAPRNASGKRSGFAIMGAGKLGSEELTYGSDLDLLFVFTEDGESSGPQVITNSDFFSRLAGRIVSLLSSMTAEGAAYRVDLRLRPLGEGGPLVQSIQGFESYFQKALKTWERQALTRVRFAAGDEEAGERFQKLLMETLYGEPPHPDLQQEIHEMRLRIEREKTSPSEGLLFFKTGEGGLIDIEFIVQYLKLRYGKDSPEMRSPHTLGVLESAGSSGMLSEEDARSLKESYLFLRRLESRARIVQDRPVTSLSADPDRLRGLALRMGYPEGEGVSPGQRLLDDYHAETSRTRQVFLRLLGNGDTG